MSIPYTSSSRAKPVAEVTITCRIPQAEKKVPSPFCPRARSETQQQRTTQGSQPHSSLSFNPVALQFTCPRLQLLIPYSSLSSTVTFPYSSPAGNASASMLRNCLLVPVLRALLPVLPRLLFVLPPLLLVLGALLLALP